MVSLCGIPSITLLGSSADWRSIRERVEEFRRFGLGTWLAALRPVLDQFIVASEGSADPEFWRSLYKENDSSGGPWATGWINVLFPYLKGGVRNPYVGKWNDGLKEIMGGGPSPADFPSGLSTVSLSWRYLEEIVHMSLVGGFVGVVQDPTSLALRPGLGWAVLEGAVPAEVQVSEGAV